MGPCGTTLVVLLPLFLALACGEPSAAANNTRIVGVGTAAIPEGFDFDDAEFALHLAYASYCDPHIVKNWTCSWCSAAASWGVTVYGVAKSNKTQQSAYVAHIVGRGIVISFRGTKSWQSWIYNLNFPITNLTWSGVAEGAGVHRGFLDAYNSIRSDLHALFAQAQADCPLCEIWIVGHSLGAAEAALCAADITVGPTKAKVDKFITFGSPRVGNAAWAAWFSDKVVPSTPDRSLRFVNNYDCVPHVPFSALPGGRQQFHHVGTEIWQHPEAGVFTVCDGSGEDKNCSFQYSFKQAVESGRCKSDHLSYFQQTETCHEG